MQSLLTTVFDFDVVELIVADPVVVCPLYIEYFTKKSSVEGVNLVF